MHNKLEDYIHANEVCSKTKNFGNKCSEPCCYMENGYCKLNEKEGLQIILKDKFNIELSSDNNILFQLLNVHSTRSSSKIKKAIISGSFDPFTYGHLDIVKQASNLFEQVYVVIFTNANKKRTYDSYKMASAITKTLLNENINNFVVDVCHDLLADYCLIHNIQYTVRGLRNNMDYNYEENISEVNKLLNKDLIPIYLRTQQAAISSSMVKELLNYNKDISKFVPEPISELINKQQS